MLFVAVCHCCVYCSFCWPETPTMNPSEVSVAYGQPVGMEPLQPVPPPPPPQQLPQQQTSVVVLAAPAPEPVPLIQSFVSHVILACCTFWCCGVVFGLVAFILAGI